MNEWMNEISRNDRERERFLWENNANDVNAKDWALLGDQPPRPSWTSWRFWARREIPSSRKRWDWRDEPLGPSDLTGVEKQDWRFFRALSREKVQAVGFYPHFPIVREAIATGGCLCSDSLHLFSEYNLRQWGFLIVLVNVVVTTKQCQWAKTDFFQYHFYNRRVFSIFNSTIKQESTMSHVNQNFNSPQVVINPNLNKFRNLYTDFSQTSKGASYQWWQHHPIAARWITPANLQQFNNRGPYASWFDMQANSHCRFGFGLQ